MGAVLTIIAMLIVLIAGCLHGYNRGKQARKQYERDGYIKDKLVRDICSP